MMELEYFVALLLFITECFHAFGHLNVFFRIRLLPRVDVVRIRFYFLFESLSVFVSSYLFLQQLQWLMTISIVLRSILGQNRIYPKGKRLYSKAKEAIKSRTLKQLTFCNKLNARCLS